ncbi:hypothetical protein NFI96_031595 [Prochilodus magdalenae]|nr:hypothetical protein NFI96_031595 [Prochilodus magdalenae]
MFILCVCVLLLPVCFSHPLAGWVSSPGHPGGYEPNSKMEWERCAPAGHTLTLSILHLDLEDSYQCENDALKIFGDNNLLLKNLCGRMSTEQLQARVNPLLHSSPGGCLFLTFHADYSNTERHTGFRAFYTVQDVDECWENDLQCSHFCHNYIGGYSCSCKPGYYLSEDQHTCTVNCTEERFGEGELTPPGSPGPYFENADCSYTLSMEEGKQFVLSFTGEFDVESRDGQCVDSLTIKTDSAIFGPFCGQVAPPTLYISATRIQVIFRTDQEGTNQGFSLTYKAKVMECPGKVTANSILSPLRSVYTVGDTVTAQCMTGYTVDSTVEKTFESTCQKSGKWSPVHSCEPIDCGSPEIPDPDIMAVTDEGSLTTYKHNISFKCISPNYKLSREEERLPQSTPSCLSFLEPDSFTCNADGEWESNEHIPSKSLPECIPVCGRNKETFSAGRVFGGQEATLGQIPWQLLVKSPKRGGAALISDRWAITAAHVVDGQETQTLTFYGEMIDALDKNAAKMETEKIIIHPGYKKEVSGERRTSYDNDIALLKMTARVPLSTNIMPVCLPEKSKGPAMKGIMGTVSGFGGTENNPSRSRYLQYGHLREYSEVPCFKTDLTVTNNMFCAGGDDFFTRSPERTHLLDEFCKRRLPHVAPTRWNFTSLLVCAVFEKKVELRQLFQHIVDSPMQFDQDTVCCADGFLTQLQSFEFNFLLSTFNHIFSFADVLFTVLQNTSLDVQFCLSRIREFHSVIEGERANFNNIFDETVRDWGIPHQRRNPTTELRGHYQRLHNTIIDNIMEVFHRSDCSLHFTIALREKWAEVSAIPCRAKIDLKWPTTADVVDVSLATSKNRASRVVLRSSDAGRLDITDSTHSLLWMSVSVCRGEVAMYGQVQSPLYPDPYAADLHTQWDLEVPPGYKIHLTFNYFNIEPSDDCYYDSLMVLYGRKVLGKFCGQKSTDANHPGNKPILSPGNRLQLVFVTDDSNPGPQTHLGFSAFYQAIDVDECSSPVSSEDSDPPCSQICLNTLGSYMCACHHGYQLRGDRRTCVLGCGGGVFKESEGTLSSPGYPNPSPLGLDCVYDISVEPGFKVSLNFSHNFHIEQIHHRGHSCLFHWLMVTVPGEKPKKYCGEESPGVIHTGSHTVQLEYHTDGAGQSRGWSLHYTTQRVECKLEKSITNGRVTPDFPQYFFRDYIHVRCDQGYKLMTGGKEIQSFRSMCQHNGEWHLPLPECKIIDCGDPRPLLNGGVTFISGSNNEYQSLIRYHCNEPFYAFREAHHVNFTCAADRKWRSDDDNAIIPPCFPVCGRPTADLSKRGRVLGGVEAPTGSFPWQVFLTTSGRGGAIVIGDRWLMTAAHNLETVHFSKENVKAYVGNTIVSEVVKNPFLAIASLHVHPGYKNNAMRTNFDNDIALIKLNSSITFNMNVMPVCLPPQDADLSSSGWVSGFGLTEHYHTANKLRYITLPVVEQELCHKSIETERAVREDVAPLTANMFCAGLPEGGKDTCSGDSGSAFVMKDRDTYWVAGIVSWGVDCGKPGKYGIYTRVTKYINWIHKTMQENQ